MASYAHPIYPIYPDPRCFICATKHNLILCTCKIIHYCSHEHRLAHWPHHAPHCIRIMNFVWEIEGHVDSVRRIKAGRYQGPNITMRMNLAPFQLGETLAMIPTRHALELSLEYINRAIYSSLGMSKPFHAMARSLAVPGIMMRLDRLHDAWDLIFQWTVVGIFQPDFEMVLQRANMGPFRSHIFQDLIPSSKLQRHQWIPLIICAIHLKTKHYFILKEMQKVSLLTRRLPVDIIIKIKRDMSSTTLMTSNHLFTRDLHTGQDLRPWMQVLRDQIWYLYQLTAEEHQFWAAARRHELLLLRDAPFVPGTPLWYTQVLVRNTYCAFEAAPECIDWLVSFLHRKIGASCLPGFE